MLHCKVFLALEEGSLKASWHEVLPELPFLGVVENQRSCSSSLPWGQGGLVKRPCPGTAARNRFGNWNEKPNLPICTLPLPFFAPFALAGWRLGSLGRWGSCVMAMLLDAQCGTALPHGSRTTWR